jgi:hypothetical protein
VEIIEHVEEWRQSYSGWKGSRENSSASDELGDNYPFVKNKRAPFTPARRALPMLNLALISSAGSYIAGSNPFETNAAEGDFSFREIPVEIESTDLEFVARGYDPAAVRQDRNAELPLDRLFEFESNGIIGQLNPVFWSFCGYIPNAARLVDEMLPRLVERIHRYEVQAALLIPASRLCHQSVSLAARAIEHSGIPTMTLAVSRDEIENVRPPRAVFYAGELGSVSGKPNWPEHQRRVLDEALRLIEPMDQAGIRKLVVELETEVEQERGER